MSKYTEVKITPGFVVKKYKPEGIDRFNRELYAYINVPFATPRLLGYSEDTMFIEKCVPIMNVEDNKKYMEPLRDLLQKAHDHGLWHRDLAMRNVVVHPKRGVLLIDWEMSCAATGDVSYDLFGARLAGTDPARDKDAPDGIWWGHEWEECPENYWKNR